MIRSFLAAPFVLLGAVVLTLGLIIMNGIPWTSKWLQLAQVITGMAHEEQREEDMQ